VKNLREVLVVEDEAKIVDVLRSFLESKGFVVHSAENGRQALEIVDNELLSLVLLDLMLPEMSGEEICVAIRKKSRVPIIMLTAKADEAAMLEGLDIGADDYVTKPFSLKALYARMEAVLRRTSYDPIPLFNRTSFNGGDLEIDFELRMVRKNKIEVKLTPNEFRILAALIKYPNKVFTRDELISNSFGTGFEGYDRAVDSHIKNIRQKIESDPKNPVYIITIHGTGYKFEGE
jgi:DNA-binding response OmpR family regulator